MSKIFDSARFFAALLSLAAIVLFAGCPPPKKPLPVKPKPVEKKEDAGKKAPEDETASAKPLAKSMLLVELDEKYNTPDGMCLLPDGDVLVSVPNVNSYCIEYNTEKDGEKIGPAARPKHPPVIIRLTTNDAGDTEVTEYFKMPMHPESEKGFPFGICIDKDAKSLYITDLQWFADMDEPKPWARILRVPLDEKYNPAGEPEVVVSGAIVTNAVVIRDGKLYYTDTSMLPGTDPVISGVFCVPEDSKDLKIQEKRDEDPHLLCKLKTYNVKVGFGADGLTFDEEGNLYIGNFADGTLHIVKFDKEGKPTNLEDGFAPIFAKVPHMKSCDGIFFDKQTGKIFVADSIANAVQVVDPKTAEVVTLAQDGNVTGEGGLLDQPSEVIVRGDEVIAANMDFPVPGGVNTTWDEPYTISVIKIPESLVPEKEE